MDNQQDSGMPESKPYEPALYQVVPSGSTSLTEVNASQITAPEIDVVFVHGFLGNAYSTWTDVKSGFIWPVELEKDLSVNGCSARVWLLDYNAPIRQKVPPTWLKKFALKWSKKAEETLRGEHTDIRLSLKERAEFLCQGLLVDQLGDRPIVFVTHSLGGLMVKAMLDREFMTRGDESKLLRSTKAVVFLGTPHSGAALANFAETLSNVTTAVVDKGVKVVLTLGEVLAGAPQSSPPLSFSATKVGKYLAEWIFGVSGTLISLQDDNPELFDLMKSYRTIARDRDPVLLRKQELHARRDCCGSI
jgi:pimeloyl-ACP methyl ester carboxylesterase